MYVLCLVTTTTSHKWEVTPDKRFYLQLRPSLWLLRYHLAGLWDIWPLENATSFRQQHHSPHPGGWRSCRQDGKQLAGNSALGAGQKSRDDVRVSIQEMGGCDDHAILSPWHRVDTLESPAPIPESLNPRQQTETQHLTCKKEAQRGEEI